MIALLKTVCNLAPFFSLFPVVGCRIITFKIYVLLGINYDDNTYRIKKEQTCHVADGHCCRDAAEERHGNTNKLHGNQG